MNSQDTRHLWRVWRLQDGAMATRSSNASKPLLAGFENNGVSACNTICPGGDGAYGVHFHPIPPPGAIHGLQNRPLNPSTTIPIGGPVPLIGWWNSSRRNCTPHTPLPTHMPHVTTCREDVPHGTRILHLVPVYSTILTLDL